MEEKKNTLIRNLFLLTVPLAVAIFAVTIHVGGIFVAGWLPITWAISLPYVAALSAVVTALLRWVNGKTFRTIEVFMLLTLYGTFIGGTLFSVI